MKNFLLLFFTLFSLATNAQIEGSNNGAKVDNRLTLHCRILYQTGLQAHRLEVDFGFPDIIYPTDADGQEIKFNCELAALNYMALQGWQYERKEGNYICLKKEVTMEEAQSLIEKMKYSKSKKK